MEYPALRAFAVSLCTVSLAAVGADTIQNNTKTITNRRESFWVFTTDHRSRTPQARA
jgi:hypothetical protein